MTATAATPNHPVTFSFGKNWERFVDESFDEGRARLSRENLLAFLELDDLRGKSFLDVGCGSGLSSLAAFDAGAERVVSFDIDEASVRTTRRLRTLRQDPPNWIVTSGSVLDSEFLTTFEPADVVYSWGVLHHTGRMWEAVRNAARLVKPDGQFFIALYEERFDSPFWLEVKRRYNSATSSKKRLMEWHYVFNDLIRPRLFRPWTIPVRIREQRQKRGMDYFTDVRDWLGGYPFEFARPEAVHRFGRDELDLELVKFRTGEACIEYLFTPRENWIRQRNDAVQQSASGKGTAE